MSWTPCWTERCFLLCQPPAADSKTYRGRCCASNGADYSKIFFSLLIAISPSHHLSLYNVTEHTTSYSSSGKYSASTSFLGPRICLKSESLERPHSSIKSLSQPADSIFFLGAFQTIAGASGWQFPHHSMLSVIRTTPSRAYIRRSSWRSITTPHILLQKHAVGPSGAFSRCYCYSYPHFSTI